MNKIDVSVVFICVGLLAASGAWTQIEEINLNTLAKRVGDKIIVLGTEGSYNNDATTTKDVVFDGKEDKPFDPKNSDKDTAWAGYEIPDAMMPTRIRYRGIKGSTAHNIMRMKGCLFEAANTTNFTDAVILHQASPSIVWDGDWVEVPLAPVAQTFTCFRIRSHVTDAQHGERCGNVTEVQFFGSNVPPVPETPLVPLEVIELPVLPNNHANFSFEKIPGALSYWMEKKFPYEDDNSFRKVVGIADFSVEGNTVTMVDPEFMRQDMVYRISAVYLDPIKSEKTLTVKFMKTDVLSGTVICSGNYPYSSALTPETVFDGNFYTHIDADGWVGLDLGEPRVITGVRYCPRLDGGWAMKDGVFQVSDTSDFTSGVTNLCTVANEPSKEPNMIELTFEHQKGRYVRFKPAVTVCNVSEIEFLGEGSPYGTPGNFTVVADSKSDTIAKLSWTVSPQDSFQKIIVQRATAPGGPWENMTPEGLLPDVASWKDMNATVGVRYYYRVGYANEIDGVRTLGKTSDSVMWIRAKWLERNWEENKLNELRTGVTAFWSTRPFAGIYPDYSAVFDNDLSQDSASCGNDRNGRIGVVLDKAYAISYVRVAPRHDWERRLNGAEVWACGEGVDLGTITNMNNEVKDFGVRIAGPIPDTTKGQLLTVPIDEEMADRPFKTVFLTRTDGKEFWCDVGELEVYGCDPTQIPQDILLAPTTVTLTNDVDFMKITWTAGKNATGYRVERKTSPDGPWVLAKDGIPADNLFYVDTDAPWGYPYYYRVGSLRTSESGSETEVAYSDTVDAWVYNHGKGTGFYAVFTQPYDPSSVEAAETVKLIRENQPATFNRDDVTELSGENFLSVWTAKLIVPLAGDYTFKMQQDDGAALWIDDEPVINTKWDSWLPQEQSKTIFLTKGEHLIRIDYNGGGWPDTLTLKWGGPIPEEIIPVTQLISTPEALPESWEGERTFNLPYKGHVSFQDGKIVLKGGGRDIWKENEGFHFLWKTVSGNFEAKMKYKLPDNPAVSLGCKIILMARNELKVGEENNGPTFYGPAAQATGGEFNYNGVARLENNVKIINLVNNWKPGSQTGWLKLRREGNKFTSFWTDKPNPGTNDWTKFGEFTGAFNKDLFVGPALTTDNDPCEAEVMNFEIREIVSGTILLLQ